MKPPTAAEQAFDDFLELVEAGREAEATAFIGRQPAEIRLEVERLVDDWRSLRERLGGGDDLASGTIMGGYRIDGELGRGGMGVVYAAEEVETGRAVALKVLAREHEYSDEAWVRFEREARLAAAIAHPRCVFVYGVAKVDGRPAIAMERMSGRTLQDAITSGVALPVAEAVDHAIEICEGLAAARRAGVIHRDVKPSNAFFDAEGGVKIGDFGISRTLEAKPKLTETGQFLGSPHYASPEQVRGEEVDHRTDVYSVGATLYALLTGQPPYGGVGLGEVLVRVLGDPVPSVRRVDRSIPRELDEIVRKAMAKSPRARFDDFEVLVEELRPFSSGARGGATRREWPRFLGGRRTMSLLRFFERNLEAEGSGFRVLDPAFDRRFAAIDRLGRFSVLGEIAPSPSGRWYIAYDPDLDRRVFVHHFETRVPPPIHQDESGCRLHWIEDGGEGEPWRVFEAPGGARLSTYVLRRLQMPWSLLRENLGRLCRQLESERPATCTAQLWIDRQGRLRVLDLPVGEEEGARLGGLELLSAVATALLTDHHHPGVQLGGQPAAAEELHRRLLGLERPFASLREAREAIEEQRGLPDSLTRMQRLLPAVAWVALCLLLAATGILTVEWWPAHLPFLRELVRQSAIIWLGSTTLLAFLLRGSAWCSLTGLELRLRDGGRPSRLRCAARAALLWFSVFAIASWFTHLGDSYMEGNPLQDVLLSLVAILFTGPMLAIMGFPAGTFTDAAMGTCVVPGRK